LTFSGPQNRGQGTLGSFLFTRLDTLVKSRQMLDYIPDANCWPAIQATTSILSLTPYFNLSFWSLSLLNLINEPKILEKKSRLVFNYVGRYLCFYSYTFIRLSYHTYISISFDSKSMKSVTVMDIVGIKCIYA